MDTKFYYFPFTNEARLLRKSIFIIIICTLCCWSTLANTHTLTCDAPINLAFSNVSGSSVQIDWVATDGNAWHIAVVPFGSGNPTSTTPFETSGGSPVTISGLDPGTAYDFYVRAVCPASQSTWTKYPGFFVTHLQNPSACQLGLPIQDNTCNNFDIDVVGYPGNLGVDIQLKEVQIALAHTWSLDVDLTLISPTGIAVPLSLDNGNAGDNYGDPTDPTCSTNTIFVTDASPVSCGLANIEDALPPFIGSFMPEQSLTGFNVGNGMANGVWTLQICDDFQDNVGSFEFVELIFESTDCIMPSNVVATSVDSTLVNLEWIGGNNTNNTIIEVVPTGNTPSTDGTPSAGSLIFYTATNPFTATGLSPNTAYDIYIREQCAIGYTNNSCAINIQTPCAPRPATITDNFDNYTQDCSPVCVNFCPLDMSSWYNGADDNMNWLVYSGPTPSNLTGPSDDANGGGKYIYIETSGSCSSNSVAYLYSNCLEVDATLNDSCAMSFDYHMNGSEIGDLTLEATTDGGQTWNTLFTLSGDQGDQWHKKYLPLWLYDGATTQFRFVGKKGAGSRGDIALDNIIFYGTQDLGAPTFTYYTDPDGDGFGDPFGEEISTCNPIIPAGYADNNLDCFEYWFEGNPNTQEIPCDGFDSNCNGDIDEYTIEMPNASDAVVCAGDTAYLMATPNYGGIINWYNSNGIPIGTGEVLPVFFPEMNMDMPETEVFYAEEKTALGCISSTQAQIEVTVNPKPHLTILNNPSAICNGQCVDLTTTAFIDENLTNGNITFHPDIPDGNNTMLNTIVCPTVTTTFYIRSLADGGCSDFEPIEVVVNQSLDAIIDGNTVMCPDGTQDLTALDAGNGTAPYVFFWDINSGNQTINVTADWPVNTSQTYAVTMTDAFGCQDVASIDIAHQQGISAVSKSSNPVSTCGGNDGSITITPVGGTAPYNINMVGPVSGNFTENSSTITLTGLSQGAYAIEIIDSAPGNCSFYIPVTIVNGPGFIVDPVITDASCWDATDGCIELDLTGTGISINWEDGTDDNPKCGLAAGNYSVTISNANCVSVLNNLIIDQPFPLNAKILEISPITCTNQSNGELQMLIDGGTPPYDIEWNNGMSDIQIDGLQAGDYWATITDAQGCELVSQTLNLFEPNPIAPSFTVENMSCNGNCDGFIEITPSGGTPFNNSNGYLYSWSTGATTRVLDNLCAGTYAVTITDSKMCTFDTTFTLTQPDALILDSFTQSDANCSGTNDGLIALTMAGGTMPYSYFWSDGGDNAANFNLAPGGYKCTVVDANSCVYITPTFTINTQSDLTVDINIDAPTCVGTMDGAIDLIPMNGVGFYQFEWGDTPSTSPVRNNLSPGTYCVTISDDNSCFLDTCIVVIADQPITPNISITDPVCFGDTNGSITVTSLGGTSPYQYEWDNGDMDNQRDNLGAGAYQFTVTDFAGCQYASDTIFIVDPPAFEVTIDAIDSLVCHDDDNANIFLTVSGGAMPYQSYTWSDGTTNTLDDLIKVPAGNYFLNVADANNCAFTTQAFNIPNPPFIDLSIDILDLLEDCEATIGDSINIAINGGVPTYNIEWNDGSDETYLIAGEGEYSVTVTDNLGCEVNIDDIKKPESRAPLSIAQDFTAVPGIDCDYGPNSGSLTVEINGGLPFYQYNWSHGESGTTQGNSTSISGLAAGKCVVTITDGMGCTIESDSLTVQLYEPFSMEIESIDEVLCKNEANGAIEISANGGAPNYSFIWQNSNGDTIAITEDVNNLLADTYTVQILDGNLCELNNDFLISEPLDTLSLDFMTTDPACFGDSTGSIIIEIDGGTPSYNIIWSNNKTTPIINNLLAGNYDVTVTDNNGCEIIALDIPIEEAEETIMLVSDSTIDNDCFGDENGSIDIEIEGGETPYTYNWSDGINFMQDPSNLPAGSYTCIVADNNGCDIAIGPYIITEPSELTVDTMTIATTGNNQDGEATIEIEGGVMPYDILWNTNQDTETITNLSPGQYLVTVTDANECEAYAIAIVDMINSVVNTIPNLETVSLYPNPIFNKATLSLTLSEATDLELSIFNQVGQVVQKLDFENIKSSNISLDFESLPSGIYSIRLLTDEGAQAIVKALKIN